jgi:hypothetical protein
LSSVAAKSDIVGVSKKTSPAATGKTQSQSWQGNADANKSGSSGGSARWA